MSWMALSYVLVVFVGPCILAGWISSRLRSPWLALLLAWPLTAVLMFAAVVITLPWAQMISPAENDGTWLIMVPIYGIVAGLPTAMAAAMVAAHRRSRAPHESLGESPQSVAPDLPESPRLSDGQDLHP